MVGRPVDHRSRELLDAEVGHTIEHGFADVSWRPSPPPSASPPRRWWHHFGTREQMLVEIKGRLGERVAAATADMAGDGPDLAAAARRRPRALRRLPRAVVADWMAACVDDAAEAFLAALPARLTTIGVTPGGSRLTSTGDLAGALVLRRTDWPTTYMGLSPGQRPLTVTGPDDGYSGRPSQYDMVIGTSPDDDAFVAGLRPVDRSPEVHLHEPCNGSGPGGHHWSMDDVQLERLWQDHADAVHAFATRRVGPTAAGDIVAEVFLVATRRPAADDVPGRAWLYGVARNVIHHQRRSEGRRARREALSAVDGHSAEVVVDLDPSATSTIIRAVEALPPTEREALLLVAWEQLTPAEAADVLGCTPGAFRVRLHRARKRLARHLSDQEVLP